MLSLRKRCRNYRTFSFPVSESPIFLERGMLHFWRKTEVEQTSPNQRYIFRKARPASP